MANTWLVSSSVLSPACQDTDIVTVHGDILPDFYLRHEGETNALKKRAAIDLKRGRQRALFIAELESSPTSQQGLKVQKLVLPGVD